MYVRVIDENDQTPTFSATHYSFVMSSAHARRHAQLLLGQVAAVDRDANDTLAYSLLNFTR